jgi:Kdo2-lipid IVA lauroyltransferase/acyltransferase
MQKKISRPMCPPCFFPPATEESRKNDNHHLTIPAMRRRWPQRSTRHTSIGPHHTSLSTSDSDATKSASPGANAEPRPTLRHWLEYRGLRLGGWALRLLPYSLLRLMAKPLGDLAWLIDRRGRATSRENLDSVFGDRLSVAEKSRIARRSYQHFARTMLELFWSPNLDPQVMRSLSVTEGLDQPFHQDTTQPIIYVCLHSSNFEWLSQNIACHGRSAIVVTQQLKNPLLGPIFDGLRSSTGHSIIPQERAMMRMLRHLKSGGIFCMVVDLNLDPREASVIIDEFDGLKTCVTKMHAALALHTGALIVPAECRVEPDGSYRMVYHDPIDYSPDSTVEEITQLCWDALQPFVLEQPEYWLWSYKHWRFKPATGDTSRYPAYANPAKRFDKLIQKQAATT